MHYISFIILIFLCCISISVSALKERKVFSEEPDHSGTVTTEDPFESEKLVNDVRHPLPASMRNNEEHLAKLTRILSKRVRALNKRVEKSSYSSEEKQKLLDDIKEYEDVELQMLQMKHTGEINRDEFEKLLDRKEQLTDELFTKTKDHEL